ncbi:LysR family transcriptional regulator [Trichococcus flocculiformis]|uniref:LysR family transcriptional regulator n=1 Tax=Trichococcus flocculiformis TaxID=82803 RepID=UPI002AAAA949|nr:LysR family transcriptional regulator [Trichococcus flocculiformis]
MIEIYLLEQFVAFAKCGTLLKAADELHISQPALSRSMKKIEQEFGVSLFHRANSKISLNETGKVAAEYAERVLASDRELIERVLSFDRGLRTIHIGACTPFPVNELIPILQEQFIGKTISSEIEDDTILLAGLKNHLYQLVILHEKPTDKALFTQRYLEEQLYISVSEGHPLAKQDSVSFQDLLGIRILVSGGVGFWMTVCKEKLSPSDLLVQSNMDAMDELVEASSLPIFNSDQMLLRGYDIPGRVSIPINDAEAHVTYYIACLASEKNKYSSVFSAVRSSLLRNK